MVTLRTKLRNQPADPYKIHEVIALRVSVKAAWLHVGQVMHISMLGYIM
jgi:hypothetical protein